MKNANVAPLPTDLPPLLQLVTPQVVPPLHHSSFFSSLFLPLSPHARLPLETSSGTVTSVIWGQKVYRLFTQGILWSESVAAPFAPFPLFTHISHTVSSWVPPDSADSDMFPHATAAADVFRVAYKLSECHSSLFFNISLGAILHTVVHIHTGSHSSPLPSPPNQLLSNWAEAVEWFSGSSAAVF